MSAYVRKVPNIEDYRLGRQPGGWWIVAINSERGEYTWAYNYQVHA